MFKDYAKFYDLVYKDKPYKKEIEFVYKWADNPETITDLGCGTASYWKYFGTDNILGIEQSSQMIGRAPYRGTIIPGNILSFKYNLLRRADCVTALFDVVNYLPSLNWIKKLPVKKGGYFIFDIWDKDKVDKEGFTNTHKRVGRITRNITAKRINNKVYLSIGISDGGLLSSELHRMYIHSEKEIIKACGKEFKIVDKKKTKDWQTWYKLKKL